MIKIRVTLASLIVLLILLMASVAWAGSSATYAVEWSVKSGGGAPATTSGNVSLRGTLGQTAIGNSTSTGDDYTLGAGYWSARGPFGEPDALPVYLPVILRNS